MHNISNRKPRESDEKLTAGSYAMMTLNPIIAHSIFADEESAALVGKVKWNVTSDKFRDLESKKVLIEGPLIHFSAKDHSYKAKYKYRLTEEYFICLNHVITSLYYMFFRRCNLLSLTRNPINPPRSDIFDSPTCSWSVSKHFHQKGNLYMGSVSFRVATSRGSFLTKMHQLSISGISNSKNIVFNMNLNTPT